MPYSVVTWLVHWSGARLLGQSGQEHSGMSSLTPEDGRLRTKLRGLHSRLGKRKVGQARQTAIQTVIAHKSGDISVSDASSLDKAAPQSVTISSRPTSPPSSEHLGILLGYAVCRTLEHVANLLLLPNSPRDGDSAIGQPLFPVARTATVWN